MNSLEHEILSLLTFPESFESILEEVKTNYPAPVVADALKNLITDKWVVPLNRETGIANPGAVYDTDDMHQFDYRATSKGLDLLER
jgi:hypothetical protein